MHQNNSTSLRFKLSMAFAIVGMMPVIVVAIIAFQQAVVTQHEVAALQEMADAAPDDSMAARMRNRLEGIQALQVHARAIFPLLATIVLLIGLLTSFILSKSIIMPLARMTGKLDEISRNDPSMRIEPVGSGEIVYLAQAINRALDAQRPAPMHEYPGEEHQAEETMHSI